MDRRILVGTDGSETAGRAVHRTVEVAPALGSTLAGFRLGPADRASAVAASEAARHAGAGIEIAPETTNRDPAWAPVERTERGNVDLLAWGNKGMSGASPVLLGSVPNKVSHHGPVALLIVRAV